MNNVRRRAHGNKLKSNRKQKVQQLKPEDKKIFHYYHEDEDYDEDEFNDYDEGIDVDEYTDKDDEIDVDEYTDRDEETEENEFTDNEDNHFDKDIDDEKKKKHVDSNKHHKNKDQCDSKCKTDKSHKDNWESSKHECSHCKNGRNGKNGLNGFNGFNGLNGLDGKDGDIGPTGPTGPAGPIGRIGDPGNTDLSAFGYLYNTVDVTVPSQTDVPLSTNLAEMVGITHTPGTAQIFVTNDGVYNINFSVYPIGNDTKQISLTVNGTVQASFNIGMNNGPLAGTLMLRLKASDFIALRNTDNNAISLMPAPFISAYVSIYRVGA